MRCKAFANLATKFHSGEVVELHSTEGQWKLIQKSPGSASALKHRGQQWHCLESGNFRESEENYDCHEPNAEYGFPTYREGRSSM